MKKWLPIAVLVAIVAIAGVFVVSKKDTKSETTKATDNSKSAKGENFSVKKACDLFVLDDAKKILGDGATSGETAASNNTTESDDVAVSSCTYSSGATTLANISNIKTASILARSAKTKTGAESNKMQFGSAKPEGVEDVSGYGDAAFWNPQVGQLNILKGSNWYILSYGTARPTDRTLDDTKKLADIVVGKL